MKRLYLTVEGQTEEEFANKVLQEHLCAFNVFLHAPRLTGPHGRRRGRVPRGGMFNTFVHALEDMRRWMREDSSPDARFSMVVDLYQLPADFPGNTQAMRFDDGHRQADALEQALATELGDPRFLPYLQVHEFEALVLSEPARFADWFEDRRRAVDALTEECSRFGSPEQINHGQHSHPKARIQRYFPDYDENVHGPLLGESIGLPIMRRRCPHFDQWLSRLEGLDREDETLER